MPDSGTLAPPVAEGEPGALRARYAIIEQRLDGAEGAEHEALKGEIIALYKRAEQEMAQLTALREDIKRLVERWKRTRAASASDAPPAAFAAERPAVVSDHINASTYVEKGWSLISLGDHEGAARVLTHALELVPDDPQTESLLGWAQMLAGRYDDALLHFQRVLTRQPTNSLARINVGYICLKKRIFGEAIEHLSKAIRLDNDRKAGLYAHFYLGLVYAEREMYEDAQSFFRKALVLGPNLIEAYYELGRALWFDGRAEDAKQAWRDGVSANKFNPWGKRCGELLAHVESGGAPPRGS